MTEQTKGPHESAPATDVFQRLNESAPLADVFVKLNETAP